METHKENKLFDVIFNDPYLTMHIWRCIFDDAYLTIHNWQSRKTRLLFPFKLCVTEKRTYINKLNFLSSNGFVVNALWWITFVIIFIFAFCIPCNKVECVRNWSIDAWYIYLSTRYPPGYDTDQYVTGRKQNSLLLDFKWNISGPV